MVVVVPLVFEKSSAAARAVSGEEWSALGSFGGFWIWVFVIIVSWFISILSVVKGEARNGDSAEVGLEDEEVLSADNPGPSPNGKER